MVFVRRGLCSEAGNAPLSSHLCSKAGNVLLPSHLCSEAGNPPLPSHLCSEMLIVKLSSSMSNTHGVGSLCENLG